MVHDGEVTPRVSDRPGHLSVALAAEKLLQEPVDGLDVVSSPCSPPPESGHGWILAVDDSERGVLDQRSGRLAGVQCIRDASKQVVERRGVVTRNPAPRIPLDEPCFPDLVPVHGRTTTAGPGRGPGAFPPMSSSVAAFAAVSASGRQMNRVVAAAHSRTIWTPAPTQRVDIEAARNRRSGRSAAAVCLRSWLRRPPCGARWWRARP